MSTFVNRESLSCIVGVLDFVPGHVHTYHPL